MGAPVALPDKTQGPGPPWRPVDMDLPFNAGGVGLIPGLGTRGFPDSSVGKESTCNAGDPGSIPGPGRYPGEGIGYPLRYSWAFVAWLVKNLPVVWETWVQSLGWEYTLEKGKVTHSSTLAWRIPWGCKESDTTEQLALHFTGN